MPTALREPSSRVLAAAAGRQAFEIVELGPADAIEAGPGRGRAGPRLRPKERAGGPGAQAAQARGARSRGRCPGGTGALASRLSGVAKEPVEKRTMLLRLQPVVKQAAVLLGGYGH
jgi:hypothetical protein